MKITSLKITRLISIPQLHLLVKRTSDFSEREFLEWTNIDMSDRISKDIFAKYNVEKNGGFDIYAKIWIQSIQYEHIIPNTFLFPNKEHIHFNLYSQMLNVLKKMQTHLNQISYNMNSNCNSANVHENNKCEKLKQWIINLFNEKIGQEYVKIIIDDQGFDDIDVFCELTENGLKEIGINKKGHRMKIMQKIKEYNCNKLQSLMKNKSMNIKQVVGKVSIEDVNVQTH